MSSGIDPAVNGWSFSTADYVVNSLTSEWVYPERPVKAKYPDGGITKERTLAGLIWRIGGSIQGSGLTPNTDVRDNIALLLSKIRGTDREKKVRLDLHNDGHYYGQFIGKITAPIRRGEGQFNLSLEFHCDDPFRRADTIIAVNETPTSSDTTVQLTNGTSADFAGNAPRIPVVLDLGGGWSASDIVRILNTTTGDRFEYIVPQTLTASESLVLDGETNEVLIGSEVVMEGVSGNFPYLRGGVNNTFDFAGTTTGQLQQYTFSFWDRFMF